MYPISRDLLIYYLFW